VDPIEDLELTFAGCFSIMARPESLQYLMEHVGTFFEHAWLRLW
jgi:hypothetical protein